MKKFNHFDIDPYGEEVWDDAVVLQRRRFWSIIFQYYERYFLIVLAASLIGIFFTVKYYLNNNSQKQEVPITIGSNSWSGFAPSVATWTPSKTTVDLNLKVIYTISNSDGVTDKIISKYKNNGKLPKIVL